MRRIAQQDFEECDNFAVLRHNASKAKEAEALYEEVRVRLHPRQLFLHQTENASKMELMLCKGMRQEIIADIELRLDISDTVAKFFQPRSGPEPLEGDINVTYDTLETWCAGKRDKILVLGQSDCSLCVLIHPLLRSLAEAGLPIGYYNLSENDFPDRKSLPICRTSPTLLLKSSDQNRCLILAVGEPKSWLSLPAVAKLLPTTTSEKIKAACAAYWFIWDDYIATRLKYSRVLLSNENMSNFDIMTETEDQAILEEQCQAHYRKENLDSASERIRNFKESILEDIDFFLTGNKPFSTSGRSTVDC